MEEAVFISKIENLKYVNLKYSRLYFGNEFCQHLIPSLEEIKTVREFVLKQQMDFTLVTPYVTDRGIERLCPVLEYASKSFHQLEVVVNDWGVLRWLRKNSDNYRFVLGRLLTKQKRGPRILNLKNKVPEAVFEHFKTANIDGPVLKRFLINMGVERIELDNLSQGINREDNSLKASLYYPFAYLTTTRYCLTAFGEKGMSFSRTIPDCNKECQKYIFQLKHNQMPKPIFLKGNSQFFKNENLPDNLGKLNINRLVYQPRIPL